MAVINTYYDFDDYNSPVKTYFDDQFYYDFVAGYEKETDIYVRQESVEQKDSFFRYTPKGDESNFITIESVKEKFKKENSESGVVMRIKFYKDSVSKSYERQVFSLLDAFGSIGGVNEIFERTGALIVGIFSGKIFLFSLLSKMYQVDPTHIDKRNSSVLGKVRSLSSIKDNQKVSNIDNEVNAENIELIEENKDTKKKTIDQDHYLNRNETLNINQSDLNKEIVQRAAENMKRRYRYSYSIFDLAYNFLMPVKVFFC